MSKLCPHCSSYNTEPKVGANVGYGCIRAARYIGAAGAFVGSALLAPVFKANSHVFAHKAGEAILSSTEDWGKGISRYHCCNCGKDFPA